MHSLYLVLTVYLSYFKESRGAVVLASEKIQELPSSLIDSLIISRNGGKTPRVIDRLEVSEYLNDSQSEPAPYPLAGRPSAEKSARSTLVLDTEELSELPCPGIQCFAHSNAGDGLTYFACSSSIQPVEGIIDKIECQYWKSHTSHKMGPTIERSEPNLGQVLSEGRGYDLKVILRPKPRPVLKRQTFPNERRIQVDYLAPGTLDWVVQEIRQRLKLKFSPVHLTISFIYIVNLRRVDLANLPIHSLVTRMNIWNPFNWEDDSFIPTRSPQKSLTQPSYFRLTVFCDHANRKSAFRRLWLPWKSWLVQFEHCHNLYACHTWISQYEICDRSGGIFTPSYFIHPIFESYPNLQGAPNALNELKQNVAGLQRLYNGHCQKEPSPWDPLNDMEMDYKTDCWRQDVHVTRGFPSGSNSTHAQDRLNESEFVSPKERPKESPEGGPKEIPFDISLSDTQSPHLEYGRLSRDRLDLKVGSTSVVTSKDRFNNTVNVTKSTNHESDGETSRSVMKMGVNKETISSSPVQNASGSDVLISGSRMLPKAKNTGLNTSVRTTPSSKHKERIDDVVKDSSGTINQPVITSNSSQVTGAAFAGGLVSKTHLVIAVIVLSLIVFILTLTLLFLTNQRRRKIFGLPSTTFSQTGEETPDSSSIAEVFMNGERKSTEHLPIISTPRLLQSTNSLHRPCAAPQCPGVELRDHLEPWLRNEPWEMHRVEKVPSVKINPWAALIANRKSNRSKGKAGTTGLSRTAGLKGQGQRRRTDSVSGLAQDSRRQSPRSHLTQRKASKPHTIVFESGGSFMVPENWPRGLHSFVRGPNNTSE